jgi:hypothetical protein
MEATRQEDYAWLATVSSPQALQELKALQLTITESYTIIPVDDLAGLYEYRVRLADGTTLDVGLISHWPQCPDYNVTDQEIFQHIRLDDISKRESPP